MAECDKCDYGCVDTSGMSGCPKSSQCEKFPHILGDRSLETKKNIERIFSEIKRTGKEQKGVPFYN